MAQAIYIYNWFALDNLPEHRFGEEVLRVAPLLSRVIDYMNPVKPRSNGVMFDNKAALPNERVADIQAPTLILHAEDDGLQLYHNAEYAADKIPNARLVSFERGGHLLLGVEQETIREVTREHMLATAG
ncbi:MAG: hypothetical protein Kow00129_16730 [Thermoleophilia bacterium]